MKIDHVISLSRLKQAIKVLTCIVSILVNSWFPLENKMQNPLDAIGWSHSLWCRINCQGLMIISELFFATSRVKLWDSQTLGVSDVERERERWGRVSVLKALRVWAQLLFHSLTTPMTGKLKTCRMKQQKEFVGDTKSQSSFKTNG